MKKLFLILAMFTLVVADALAQGAGQGSPGKTDFVYIPRRYNAIAATGDSLISGKVANASMDDTTRPVILAGWSEAFVTLEQAVGTAGTIIVSYQGSTDGQSFGTNFIVLDSLTWTAATAKKSFPLMQKCGGFYSVRLRFTGSAVTYTGSSTYTARIRKKQ